MSGSYTPGLKILSRTKIIKRRRLPMKGNVHLKIGDIVKSDEIVASTELPGNVQMLNVANKLNIEPENVPECMLVELDESISKGQIIAESKGIFGMFKSQLNPQLMARLPTFQKLQGRQFCQNHLSPLRLVPIRQAQLQKFRMKRGLPSKQRECWLREFWELEEKIEVY